MRADHKNHDFCSFSECLKIVLFTNDIVSVNNGYKFYYLPFTGRVFAAIIITSL